MTTKKSLIKKFGSEEKVSEYYREMQKKSRLNYSGTGGFHKLSKEDRIKAAKRGADARWGGRENSKGKS